MKFTPVAEIPDLVIVEPRVFTDHRGFFLESFHRLRFEEAGLDLRIVQENHSYSVRGVLRGLHFQNPNPQGKLVRVVRGEVFDVAVDVRRGSPTFGRWAGVTLSETNRKALYIPPGFAHGFVVTGEEADVIYGCTDLYDPESDRALAWDDPELGIEWPVIDPIISKKDRSAPTLRQLAEADALPHYDRSAAAAR